MGYHFNGNVVTPKDLLLAAIAAPSTLMMLRDSGAGSVWDKTYLRPYPGDCDDTIGWVKPANAANVFRHRNGFNLLLADSHVKWYSPASTFPISQFPEDTGVSLKAQHPGTTYCH